jgi:hypothetical protein
MLIERKDHPLWLQWAARHKTRSVLGSPDAYFQESSPHPVKCWQFERCSAANWEAMWIDSHLRNGDYIDRLEERGYDL